jgi:pimeloyl-ACP methyl ester carboxylesterase
MKPELVLLPGMLCDDAYWAPQRRALEAFAELTVASYPRAETIDEMASAVISAAPPLFAVAGHSMGGRVALEIAAQVPDRLTGLGLFGTDYRGLGDPAARAAESAARRDGLDFVAAHGMEAYARRWAASIVAPSRAEDADLIERIVGMVLRQPPGALEAHGKAGLSRADHAALLPQIRVPTLVVAGGADTRRPAAAMADMARRIPDSRFVTLEGCGHMLSMEDPAGMTAVMRPWLEEVRLGILRRAPAAANGS